MGSRTTALAISYISEPFFTSGLAVLLVLIRLDSTVEEKILWGLLTLFFGAAPPALVFLKEKRTGRIKDWFITSRIERRDVHLAWFFGSALLAIVFWQLSAPRLVLATVLSLLALSAAITAATYAWKISVHVVGITFLVLILLLVYSSNFLPATLLIAFVAWTRIYLGHHTLSQVSAAAIITILVVYYVFSLFGLATF